MEKDTEIEPILYSVVSVDELSRGRKTENLAVSQLVPSRCSQHVRPCAADRKQGQTNSRCDPGAQRGWQTGCVSEHVQKAV